MPIKKLEKQLAERGVLGNFPRFGKLRKGAEKPEDNKGRLKDLDYFRLTLEPQYEHIRPAFVQLYGDKPTEFRNVFLTGDNGELSFQYFYEAWAHARLLRRCDGETICVSFHDGPQEYDDSPHPCTCNPHKPDCDIHGRLDVVLPELYDLTGSWGKFTIETGSIYDCVALRSAMIVADAFAANIPNTAFWSIPFRVGRATRPVPVTINGKRSIKPMSLLFAEVEPEFNQKVVQPRLTAQTQKLLAGVNPETGEMPEISMEQPEAWDREYVNAQTLHLFAEANHQANTIDKMLADGELTDAMTDDEAIAAIEQNRARRAAEKQAEGSGKNASKPRKKGSNSSAAQSDAQSDLEWAKDAVAVGKLIAQAHQKFGFQTGDVLAALNAISPDELTNLQDFIGMKHEAWAACIARFCGYDSARVDAYLVGNTPEVIALREAIKRQLSAAQIPF